MQCFHHSPYCNPTEHKCVRFQRQIYIRKRQYQNLEEFANDLREEWRAVDHEFIGSLILSLTRSAEGIHRARLHQPNTEWINIAVKVLFFI